MDDILRQRFVTGPGGGECKAGFTEMQLYRYFGRNSALIILGVILVGFFASILVGLFRSRLRA
jgi:hypothetical protein